MPFNEIESFKTRKYKAQLLIGKVGGTNISHSVLKG
jgi:hypothetical protein